MESNQVKLDQQREWLSRVHQSNYRVSWFRIRFHRVLPLEILLQSCCGQIRACRRSRRNRDTEPMVLECYRPEYIAPGSCQRPRRPRLNSWKVYQPGMQVRSCVGTEIQSLCCLEARGQQLPRWCRTKDPANRASSAKKPLCSCNPALSMGLLRLETYACYRLMCVTCLCNGLIMTSICIPRVLRECVWIPRKLKNL